MAYVGKPGRARVFPKRACTPSHYRWKCEPLEPRLVPATTPIVIDLLAVYTPGAAAYQGGDAHLQSLIKASVDSMNQALINTQLSITVRLVHVESISYTGSNNLFTDRTRLETSGDGYMDSIFTLRNQYGADLVTLITDGNVSGGNADLMIATNDSNNPNLAFSAIAYSSIGPGQLTLAHDLGHNLGGGHERNNPTQPAVGPFSDSYGYRFSMTAPPITASYNDIMSYGYGTDIPLFSYANPNVLMHGVPTGKPSGDPNSADIAATFVQTAPIVANYRAIAVADTTAPTAALFETNRNGSSLNFTIRYTDDSGIDFSTIGSGDVNVSGPGGFSLPATFVSMDNPTVAGAYKLVTYHVTLPVSNPATGSLSFDLQSNAIKDIENNSVASGAIANHTAFYAGSPVDFSHQHAAYTWAQPLSATLSPGSTFNLYGSLTPDNLGHYYSFTLTQSTLVEATLTGLSNDANITVLSDANNNDLDDDSPVTTINGGLLGAADEGFHGTLGPGTYYVRVNEPSSATTPYVLSLRAIANDTTPPTAMVDAHDLTTAGAPYITFAVTYTDDNFIDGLSSLQNAAIDITIQFDAGGGFTFFYNPNSAQNTSFADAATKTIYYDIFAFNSMTGWTSNENGTYTLSIHNGGSMLHDVSGNNIALGTLGSYRIAIGTPDATRPTAKLSASPPVAGLATWDFNVIYQDSGGLNAGSLDNNDILVTGPNSFSQLATFVSVTPASAIGGTRTATYRVTAPGGYWDSTDDGAYTVSLQSNQVKDNANNFALSTSFSPITASSPALTSLGALSVSFNGSSVGDIMRIDSDSTFVYFNLNDSSLYFVPKASISRFTINSLGGDDLIYYQSGTFTGSIFGGLGNNALYVTGGSLTLDADGGASSSVLTVSVAWPGSLVFNSTQHLAGLTLTGSANASIAPGGGKVVITKALSIAPTATMDVNDDGLVLDYTGSSPITTIRGLIQSGFNGGAWNGFELSSTAARNDATKAHDLGYAEASALGVSTFIGQSIDSTSILVHYTHSGNANLDQVVDVADLNAAAKNYLQTGKVYSQGDFNYDGVVDVTDLKILAANWGKTSSGLSMAPLLGPMPAILPLGPPPPPIVVATLSTTPSKRTPVRVVTLIE